jgi:hypothetical protein
VEPGGADADGHMPAGEQMQTHSSAEPVTAADLTPPGFAQHCAAVALWGHNLRSIWPLVNNAVSSLCTVLLRSGAQQLVSWLPGVWHVSSQADQGNDRLLFVVRSNAACCKPDTALQLLVANWFSWTGKIS